MERFIKTPFAFLGDRSEIPDPIQTSGDVSMMTGYGYDYERDQLSDANAKNIERQKMNWLFYIITRAISEYQSSGAPEFITTVMNGGNPYPYQKSALVRFNSGIYYSLVDNNTATPEDKTKWAQLMYSSEDIFDGYLRIDELLSEIAEQGVNAQKQARKNIGIDGDIAYRDKENTFKEKNIFNQPTQFNDDVTVAAGKKISAPTIWLTYNGEKMGALSGSVGDTVNLISDAKLLLGGATVHDLKYLAGNTEYEVWHAGNYDPVRTVNYIGPDKNGNVSILPKFNGDAAYSYVSVALTQDKSSGKSGEWYPITFGQCLAGSKLRQLSDVYMPGNILGTGDVYPSGGGGLLAGTWRACATARAPSTVIIIDPISPPYAYLLVNRVAIGTIDAFTNIRTVRGGTNYVDLICDIEGVGTDIEFTASADDPEEYGRQLYANARSGMYPNDK
ncbi:hypothetical protein ACUMLB_003411 [Escherichia coli]|nr:hypothetical protein [Escherichia coli]EJI0954841.1 hypothetical protein [Escherichia coli]EKG6774928.1 hypothetical protein [Escherichia coli]ELX1524445.1 hypothetical protein [Escherichia coli]